MAQRPKSHVRAEIVRAATALFAETGYEDTTMGAIADRSGVSTGNVYRYFEGKEALLEEVLPASFASDLRRRIRARVEALGTARDARTLGPDAPYHVLSSELLEHCIENRERVVILLGRASGTPFDGFAAELQRGLVSWAMEYARQAWPAVEITSALRFALARIYAGYVASLTDALATFRRGDQIREVVGLLATHHLGGLGHLFEAAASRRSRS